MAKIVLINPCPGVAHGINEATLTPPLGLAYLAAVLEKNGHTVRIIDAHILGSTADKITAYFDGRPDLIGISANIVTYRGAIACATQCKKVYRDTPIVFGGPYPSSLASKILKDNTAVDAVVMGEGEYTVAEIADSLDKKNVFEGIRGVMYRFQGDYISNKSRPLIDNLDEIPFPAYHLLPDLATYRTRSRARPVGYIFSSRGCPFQCSFCNKNIFGARWRPHSVDRVVNDITRLVEEYGVRQIDILDDNFTFDKARTHDILDRLVERHYQLSINLQNGVRIDRMDEELLRKMKQAGVFKIGFGIETANVGIQREIKKRVDLDKARNLVSTARSLGIVTIGFFIMGLPGDNAKSMKETIDYIIRLDPHMVNTTVCVPFPGTELFETVKREGVFLEDVEHGIDTGFFGDRVFFTVGSMKREEILSYFRKAYRRFYMRPSKVLDVARTIKSFEELKWLLNVSRDIVFKRS